MRKRTDGDPAASFLRSAALICLIVCLALVTGCAASPSRPPSGGSVQTPEETAAPPAEDAEPETHVELPYPEIRIYLDSLLWDRGFVRGETAYLPLSLFCRELNMEPLCVMTDGVLTVQAHSLELSAGAGDEYMTVNGRYIFTPGGFVMVGDEPYIPAEAAEAIFNVKITAAEDMSRLDLDMDGAGVITGGERYYTLNFDSADVFWLSRIIFAEATGQPLAGRIAVGNVVLNRVAHEEYPDSIHEVIFDTKGGVQFDTTLSNAVLNEADELSVIAAYMALDGVNTAGNSLFFVNPAKGDDSWFRAALEHVETIGDHDFYTIKGA